MKFSATVGSGPMNKQITKFCGDPYHGYVSVYCTDTDPDLDRDTGGRVRCALAEVCTGPVLLVKQMAYPTHNANFN